MIRIVVAGTTPFGVPSFNRLMASDDVTIAGVISQPARPVGRHQQTTPTPVADWAKSQNLPLLTPANWKSIDDLAALRAWSPDIIVVAAYGVLVPESFLAIPHFGGLNIHASILPHYRGASPIAAAILNGDQETGITFMKMDVGLDTGNIYSIHRLPLGPTDTTPEVSDRLANLAAEHIVDCVRKIVQGTISGYPQPLGATYAKKIRRSDGAADWSSSILLERKTRAYTPWPGVWTRWKDVPLKLLSGKALPGSPTATPGTILQQPDGNWAIQCQDGLFQPNQVQFAGKKPQPASSIPGSYPGFIGSQLIG